jgi:hypothetical protein
VEAVISEKTSARSAPAAVLTASSIMKKKSSPPLHEAPFGVVRQALGTLSVINSLITFFYPSQIQVVQNSHATSIRWYDTIRLRQFSRKEKAPIDESWSPRSYYHLRFPPPLPPHFVKQPLLLA